MAAKKEKESLDEIKLRKSLKSMKKSDWTEISKKKLSESFIREFHDN